MSAVKIKIDGKEFGSRKSRRKARAIADLAVRQAERQHEKLLGSYRESTSPDAAHAGGLRFVGFDTDLDSVGYQEPLRASLSLDLDPTTLLALQCILDARAQGLDIRIVTQPDLVSAVDKLVDHGLSVGGES